DGRCLQRAARRCSSGAGRSGPERTATRGWWVCWSGQSWGLLLEVRFRRPGDKAVRKCKRRIVLVGLGGVVDVLELEPVREDTHASLDPSDLDQRLPNGAGTKLDLFGQGPKPLWCVRRDCCQVEVKCALGSLEEREAGLLAL